VRVGGLGCGIKIKDVGRAGIWAQGRGVCDVCGPASVLGEAQSRICTGDAECRWETHGEGSEMRGR
jgi:hypothetical protein